MVRQASCHLSIQWKRKHDRLRVSRLGVSCSCVPKWLCDSGQVICFLQASFFKRLSFQHQCSPQSGSLILALQTSCAVGMRACLYPGAHGRHLTHIPWTCVCCPADSGHDDIALAAVISRCTSISGQQFSPWNHGQLSAQSKTELFLVNQERPK